MARIIPKLSTILHWQIFLVFIAFCCNAQSQNKELNLLFGGGPNFIFADKIDQHKSGHSYVAGLNMVFGKQNRPIKFNPGIYFNWNHYNTLLDKNVNVSLQENLFVLNLDVLLKISSRNFLRFGISASSLRYARPGIEVKDGSNYVIGFSNSNLYEGFSTSGVHGKVTMGVCMPLKFWKHAKFNLSLVQNVTPVVSSDYSLETYSSPGTKVVYNAHSYPAHLLAALEIDLVAKRKKKDLQNPD